MFPPTLSISFGAFWIAPHLSFGGDFYDPQSLPFRDLCFSRCTKVASSSFEICFSRFFASPSAALRSSSSAVISLFISVSQAAIASIYAPKLRSRIHSFIPLDLFFDLLLSFQDSRSIFNQKNNGRENLTDFDSVFCFHRSCVFRFSGLIFRQFSGLYTGDYKPICFTELRLELCKSEYVIYKLKEMGKISEKDISQICNQFNKLDPNNLGEITLPVLLEKRL